MAHANIYIRKENEAKWEALEDKSDFVNTLLEEQDEPRSRTATTKPVPTYVSPFPIVNVPSPKKEIPLIPGLTVASKLPKVKLCKHGNPIGQCFDKQAGRSCRL